MKKQNTLFYRASQWLLTTLLAWFGFSCSQEVDEAMYGTPYANFEIKGRIVDIANRPIAHAQIEVSDPTSPYPWLSIDTVYTDAEGMFSWQKGGFPTLVYQLIVSGPDGDKYAGTYAADTSLITFKREEMTGADGWYDGRGVRDTTIMLKNFTDSHQSPYALYTFHGTVTDPEGHPLPGILITTRPGYAPYGEDKLYAAITNEWGKYRFTLDKAAPVEHTFYASLADFWWKMSAYRTDSVQIDISQIPLSGGKGMLTGRGEKEINFQLKKNNGKSL